MANGAFFLVLVALGLVAQSAAPSISTAQSARSAARTSAQADTVPHPLARAVRGLRLRSIGPALISGRISDLAVHPKDKKIWYVAAASGGLWKTTNAGTTFTPLFDSEGSYSIGVVVIDPRNPNVIWVGTGENNAQRSVSYGDGVYKSIDGGRTWQHLGLRESQHIGKILIDPRNSDVVYVAAQGPLFSGGGDRGLFKTEDGGKTWKKILDAGEWGGASDVVMDPRNPDVLIASTWQRARRQWGYIAGGPASGVWRSVDGGASWTRVQRGLPNEELGRIGLAISPANPDVVYAIVEAANRRGGFYRSRDNGVNWERMSDHNTIGLYYAEIFADPKDVDRVYSMDVRMMVTEDGGRTFRPLGERNKHVDNHALWIDPDDTEHLLIGCDGGLYESFDRGQTYIYFPNLPLGQFYRVEVDNSSPFYRVYGGTQDNSTVGGPSRTRTRHGITNHDWFFTQGGDGFQTRVDPTDPDIVYSQSQYGNLARFDLRTGERIDIVPQPEPGEADLRWHWDSPLIISPHSPTRLYFAAQRIYRSDDRGDSWKPISGDLSRQIDRNRLRIMGRVWSVDAVAKNTSTSPWGSVVALAESPLKEGLIWAGTDDGLIHVTEDGGANWRRIDRIAGVPETTFVSRLTPSQHDGNTVYASFDNHKAGDYRPYIAKSTDLGRTWTLISGNLPERGSVYVVIEDHKDPNLLFAGTEFGLYFTQDGGRTWTRLGSGLPTIQVRDLAIQKREDDLVVATFGRGFYILDDISPLRQLDSGVLAQEAYLFPVKKAPLYIESNPLGGAGAAWQGARFYTASNPPFGAVFTYYLKEELKTRRERRQEAERQAVRQGRDVFYPPWDSLKAEDREEAPSIILTVSDSEGRIIRRITGPTGAGIHRVAWDLRYPAPNPARTSADDEEDDGFGPPAAGPYVIPGIYRVSLSQRVDGIETPLGVPQSFEVYHLDADRTPRSAAVLAFQRRTAELQRAVLGANALINETLTRIAALKRAVNETPATTGELASQLRQLENRLREIQEALNGDPTRARRQEPTPPSLASRLNRISSSLWSSTLGEVTQTQRRQYEIAASEFGDILERLRGLLEVDLRRLEEQAESAGVPWTSGRIPRWLPR